MNAAGIMDDVQALFSFFIAPLFGTVLLRMIWKRATTPGGFWGLLAGTATSIGLWGWVQADPAALRFVALSSDAQSMAENLYRALWSWLVCVGVTVVVSLMTRPRPIEELNGLVYGATTMPVEKPVSVWHQPWLWATIAACLFFALNIYFW